MSHRRETLPPGATGHKETIRRVVRLLERYGTPNHGNKSNPVDEIVYLILSKQTDGSRFRDAYGRLRSVRGGWSRVARLPVSRIARMIRRSGLERQKANQIRACLRSIKTDAKRISLAGLHGVSDDEAYDYLMRLPGVGIKTAYCVMMYALGRAVLPVDTHVYRISTRLGLLPTGATTKAAHATLNALVPKGRKYSYHVNCICHGRAVCRTTQPRCGQCMLAPYCSSARRAPAVSRHS